MRLKLLSKINKTNNVFSFIFEPESPINWKAGQYLIYFLEHEKKDLRGKMRFFTISSAPFEKNPSITTRIFDKKGSSFKNKLFNLKIGETIDAKGPDGDFVIDDLKKKYVLIAGGIGITPFYSILKQLDFEKKKVDITLLYFSGKDITFNKELNKIEENNKNLKINYLIGNKKIDVNMLKKFIDKKSIYYVSGPDPMVDEIIKLLLKLKVARENIKDDYFSGY